MRHVSSGALAVLIDGDNVSPRILGSLMREISKYGMASVRRIYGDWTSPNLKSWKSCLLQHAIQPVQQFAYRAGKNATDGAMIIDAMDLLHSDHFSGFCLVSSDSDFTGLAIRIRQQGVQVYGLGERHTLEAFVAACDRFIYFDTLSSSDKLPDRGGIPIRKIIASRSVLAAYWSDKQPDVHPVPARLQRAGGQLDDAVQIELEEALLAVADDQGRATLASVGNQILKQMPSFDCRNYGFAKLSDLAEACDFLEVERVGETMQSVTVRWLPIHSDVPPPKNSP